MDYICIQTECLQMLINDRIRLIMKASDLSASAFSEILNVNKSSVSHILSGRNKPGLDFLEKVIQKFPNVNASWLITGETREGEFKPGAAQPQNQVAPKEIDYIAVFYKNGTYKRYLSEEEFSAGS